MSAVVTITQTPKGWEVVAADATDIKVKVEGQDLVIRLSPTPEPASQPLDVALK